MLPRAAAFQLPKAIECLDWASEWDFGKPPCVCARKLNCACELEPNYHPADTPPRHTFGCLVLSHISKTQSWQQNCLKLVPGRQLVHGAPILVAGETQNRHSWLTCVSTLLGMFHLTEFLMSFVTSHVLIPCLSKNPRVLPEFQLLQHQMEEHVSF